MAPENVILTKNIARLRKHVERAIGRLKNYRILQGVISAAMWDDVDL